MGESGGDQAAGAALRSGHHDAAGPQDRQGGCRQGQDGGVEHQRTRGAVAWESKSFFFGKKKQKTFDRLSRCRRSEEVKYRKMRRRVVGEAVGLAVLASTLRLIGIMIYQ